MEGGRARTLPHLRRDNVENLRREDREVARHLGRVQKAWLPPDAKGIVPGNHTTRAAGRAAPVLCLRQWHSVNDRGKGYGPQGTGGRDNSFGDVQDDRQTLHLPE